MGMTLGCDSQQQFKKLTYERSQKSKRLIKADFLLSGSFWYHQKLKYYGEVCKISGPFQKYKMGLFVLS